MKRVNFSRRKAQRHLEAVARQAKYDRLSTEDKIVCASRAQRQKVWVKIINRQRKGSA